MQMLLSSLARRLPADHAELSDVRVEVSSWLENMLGPDDRGAAIADIAVVLTELVANVIDHTECGHVDVVVRVEASRVSIEVANDGSAALVPPVSRWGVLAEGDRGRGLRLVRALCDEIELVDDPERTIVRCCYRVS